MNWLYKLLGFKKMKVTFIDDNAVAIEHQDNDDFEMPMDVIKTIKPNLKEGDYIWIK